MNRLLEHARTRLAYALARVPDPVVRYVTARRPIEVAGRRLEPRTQHALALIRRAGRPPLDELPVERARREYANFPRVFEDPSSPRGRGPTKTRSKVPRARCRSASTSAALAAAGVRVRYRCCEGLVHGFAQMTGAVPEARRAVLDAVEELRACLRGA